MPVRPLLLGVCLASLFGCAPLGGLDRDCLLDGGVDGCLPPPDVDGLGEVEPPADADAGDQDDVGFAACLALIEEVCGVGEPPPCQDAPACAAAQLLQAHVPGECSAALTNDVTYPACRPGPCAFLVDRVCGGLTDEAACHEAPGCEPARVLLGRSSSTDADERAAAEASCNAALEDDTVFAPCG